MSGTPLNERVLFTTPDVGAALEFAARTVSKEGGQTGLVLVVLPRNIASTLKRGRNPSLLRKGIDDMPGVVEHIFEPSAIDDILKFGIVEDVSHLIPR